MNINYRFSYPGDAWMLRVYGDFTSRSRRINAIIFSYVPLGVVFLTCSFFVERSALAFLIFGIGFLIISGYVLVCKVRKRGFYAKKLLQLAKYSPEFGLSGTKEISDEGLTTCLENGSVRKVPWSGISDSIEGVDYFYFVNEKLMVALLNKGDMSPEQIQELREWLTSQGKWGKGSSAG